MDIYKINKNLQAEFARKNIYAETKASNNLFRANSNPHYAKLSALEREIMFLLGTENAKAKPDKAKISSLKKSLELARNEQTKLLSKMGLKKEELSPIYECEKCKDSGFVGGEMCDCYIARRNAELIKECGLSASELVGFADFDTKIFADEKQKNDSIKLKDFLTKWCNNYPAVSKNKIVLLGKTGTGKTFFSKCMAKELINKGLSVCYVSAFEMNNLFLKYHTTFDESKLSVLVPLIESEILFIDDLGTEPNLKNVTENYLFLILSERERFNRPTIITTNLGADGLSQNYGERIYSRLSDKKSGIILKLEGEDLRYSKKR